MNTILPWLIVFGGPILGAIAGATGMHFNERIHWHRLAQTWYDDGYNAGWAAAKRHYGTMVPDMAFTQAGTLEAVLPAAQAKWAANIAAISEDSWANAVTGPVPEATEDQAPTAEIVIPSERARRAANDYASCMGHQLPYPEVADGDQLAEVDEWDTITINLAEQFDDIKAALYLP